MKEHKGNSPEYVRIIAEKTIVYHGKWSEIPIEEQVMLSKSEEYFGDPEPCYIHRAAVRMRLLGETGELIMSTDKGTREKAIARIRDCMGCSEITAVECYETPI